MWNLWKEIQLADQREKSPQRLFEIHKKQLNMRLNFIRSFSKSKMERELSLYPGL